jgi:hypothetical protein
MKFTDMFLHAYSVAFFKMVHWKDKIVLKFAHSSVHVVTKSRASHLRIVVQFLAEAGDFYLLHTVHTGCSATSLMGNRVSFPGSEVTGTWR